MQSDVVGSCSAMLPTCEQQVSNDICIKTKVVTEKQKISTVTLTLGVTLTLIFGLRIFQPKLKDADAI